MSPVPMVPTFVPPPSTSEQSAYMTHVRQSAGMQFSAWMVHQAGAMMKQGLSVLVMGVGMYWTGLEVMAGTLPAGDFVAIAAYVTQVRGCVCVRVCECV
jgi:hypothetical protein